MALFLRLAAKKLRPHDWAARETTLATPIWQVKTWSKIWSIVDPVDADSLEVLAG
jgi:hypothetical protein